MPYTAELIPDADIAKHDLLALCQRYARMPVDLDWVVDRQNNSFLMHVRSNPQDPAMSEFVFYWNGGLSEEMLSVETTRHEDGSRHLRWRRLPVFSRFQERPEDAVARTSALKEALACFRSRGVRSLSNVSYVVEFDF